MDEYKKNESGITKRHFAKFHERIQNKYAQMQIRLEKSRSMESISSLGEEFVSYRTPAVSEDKGEESEIAKSEKKCVKYSIIVEDIHKQDAVLQDSDWTHIYESEVTPQSNEDDADKTFFGNEFSSSLENVQEASEVFENLTPITTLQKFTMREKISAAGKRRKEEKIKKKEEKDNKRRQSEIENPDKFILSNKSGIDSFKKKNKVASVIVALIEATEPENETAPDEKHRQLYCRIRLGQEKFKSKAVKMTNNVVSWQELFNLSFYEDKFLEITVWEKEKDVLVGRITVDLIALNQNITHKMNLNLEEGESTFQISMLITISGIAANTLDANDWSNRIRNELIEMEKKFSRMVLNDDFENVGWLTVFVFEARGLAYSDCYASCVLDNARVQTHTEHKTQNPCWMKMFNFSVMDSTSILHVVIHDEKKADVVGQISVPLLRIVNGEKKWYALKDVTSRERAKGNNPRIYLEMHFFYNLIKSSVRVINPKTVILLERELEFKRQLFTKNIARARVILDWLTAATRIVKTMFEWESRRLNVAALTAWLIFWWFYKAWMLSLLFLIPFYWYRPEKYHFTSWHPDLLWRPFRRSTSTRNSDIISVSSFRTKESRSSTLIQKIYSLQETVTTVQNTVGTAASLGESVKNLFNFTVPYLSFLAIFGIFGISLIFYLIPVKIIMMAWGVHKFLRKTLRPNRIPNNEILDLLSRVPDDETLLDCEELPLLPVTDKNETSQLNIGRV